MNYKKLVGQDWVDVDYNDLVDGDRIKKEVINGVWQESNFLITQHDDVFSLDNISVAIDGNSPTPYSPIYFVNNGDSIVISADIVNDENSKQSQLDQNALLYPPVLALPLTKYAGGANGMMIDEVYFEATLVNGTISTNGSLPSAGNWKIETKRVNESLKAIGADWAIDYISVNFMVR